jgi:hypothetical protein
MMVGMKKTVFVATIPWDYRSATSDVFTTRKEAEEFIKNAAETEMCENASTIQEKELIWATRNSSAA